MSERIEKARFDVEQACGRMEDLWSWKEFDQCLDELIAAVREDEREMCARVLEETRTIHWCEGDDPFELVGSLAEAIRARGGT